MLELLKEKLKTAAVLAFCAYERSFTVETDGSSVDVSVFLSQKSDGGIHLMHYASRSKSETKRLYSICEQEPLAVILSLRIFHAHLFLDRAFTVLTDNQALQYDLQKRDVRGRLAKCLEFMEDYDFVIRYRPATSSGAADFLPRISCTMLNSKKRIKVVDIWVKSPYKKAILSVEMNRR